MPSFGIRQPKQLDLAVDGRKQLAVETPHLKRTAAYVSIRQHTSASSAYVGIYIHRQQLLAFETLMVARRNPKKISRENH
jgi:hypothetical protein